MLPSEWKKEIQESHEKTQQRSDEGRKREQDHQTVTITAPLHSLRNHFKAYIKKQDCYEQGKRRREITTIYGLFITAAFTLVVAVVGGLQTYTFIISERAFVAPEATNFTNGMVVRENPLHMWIDMHNGGKSAATIKELVVTIAHELQPKPEYFTAQKIAFPPILPGGTIRRDLAFVSEWPQETIDKLTSGALKFYIYGVIRYRDDFSWFGLKETGFCFRYVPGPQSGPYVFATCYERPYSYTR
jgi:hypothetical protein